MKNILILNLSTILTGRDGDIRKIVIYVYVFKENTSYYYYFSGLTNCLATM